MKSFKLQFAHFGWILLPAGRNFINSLLIFIVNILFCSKLLLSNLKCVCVCACIFSLFLLKQWPYVNFGW